MTEEMQKLVAELTDTIAGLAASLTLVLKPENPVPQTDCDAVEGPPESQLTRVLNNHCNQLKEIIEQVRDLDQRLDIPGAPK